jgi:hypothetical protein
MSRQYPEPIDIEYITGWAERKIIQLARSDRNNNFSKVADFTRSITIFLDIMEMYSDSAQSWLRRRISDTYYAVSGMRMYEEGTEKFNEFEDWLVETLKFIVEYYLENGCMNPMMELFTDGSLDDTPKVWRPPSRWLEKYSGQIDELE